LLTEKRTLVRNTLLNGLSQSAAMLAAFIFMPLLVRSFGLVNYGLYVLISAVAAYAALLDFGIGAAVTRNVAEADATGDPSLAHQAVSTALVFYTVVGVLVALVMVLVGAFAGEVFHVSAQQASLLRTMLWIAAAFQLFAWPASTARYALAGLQRYDLLVGAALLGTALNVVATVYVLATGSGPAALVALTGVASVVSAGTMVLMVMPLLGPGVAALSGASYTRLVGMLGFGWAVFVVQLSDVLFYQQTDRLILGVLAGAVAVGLYEASAKVNNMVTYLSGLTVSAVMPLASSMDAASRHASLRSLFIRGTKYGAAFVVPVAALVVVFSEPLLVAWLGPRFAGQGIVMQTLVFPHVLVALGLMGDAIVISRGRMGRRVPYILGQAVANVVLSVLLVPRIGVLGVAVGTAVAHLVDFPIHVRFLLRETHVTFASWLREVVVPVYPLLVVPVGLGVLLARSPLASSVLGIALAVVIALGAYWLAFYALGLTADEREDFRGVLRSFLGQGDGDAA